MLRKKEGFDGQRAIVLPRKILTQYCITNPLIAGAYITDIGYYPKAKHHYRERMHGVDQHILIYCLEGKGIAQIKEEEYDLDPGDFILIPANTVHQYSADDTNPWTIYWVHFKGDVANNIIEMFVQKNISFKGTINYQDSRIHLFEDIYSNLEMGYSSDNLCYVNMCLQYFLTSFIFNEHYNIADKKQSNDTINCSITFMQENIDKMLTLKSLSDCVHLSASHFSFLFRKKTGFSPIEHFNHLKVQKACQYLLFTDLRIKEIADKLGIEDPYYFSRMFTKIMGMSPAAYRIKRIS
ncbi:MAG TPA: AraC family transcriptional regulator [Hanamia sp.]|jgi:AraC-like DNA-binding protein/mannose-6-phosphate isomerase-like protein (cupin superfamily)|nr:AraC family transcriptional regulator [Hanamia sp.]